jgi:hypothetical protein
VREIEIAKLKKDGKIWAFPCPDKSGQGRPSFRLSHSRAGIYSPAAGAWVCKYCRPHFIPAATSSPPLRKAGKHEIHTIPFVNYPRIPGSPLFARQAWKEGRSPCEAPYTTINFNISLPVLSILRQHITMRLNQFIAHLFNFVKGKFR